MGEDRKALEHKIEEIESSLESERVQNKNLVGKMCEIRIKIEDRGILNKSLREHTANLETELRTKEKELDELRRLAKNAGQTYAAQQIKTMNEQMESMQQLCERYCRYTRGAHVLHIHLESLKNSHQDVILECARMRGYRNQTTQGKALLQHIDDQAHQRIIKVHEIIDDITHAEGAADEVMQSLFDEQSEHRHGSRCFNP